MNSTRILAHNTNTMKEKQYRNGTKATYFPNKVTRIDGWTYSGNKLTSVTIPPSVTHIGDNAFCNNELSRVNIPSSVTHIGDNAFSSNKLTSVTILC